MPLADYTAICNLALDHLGEPYLTNYATDTIVAAQACRLHLPQCVETVLEGHVWSFATRCSQLTAAPVTVTTASLVTGDEAENTALLWSAVAAGPSGNEISVEIAESDASGLVMVEVSGNAITVTPSERMRLVVSGATAPLEANGNYSPAADRNERSHFVGSDYQIYWSGSQWNLTNLTDTALAFYSEEDVAHPDLVPSWIAVGIGTLEVVAEATTAAEVIAAVEASVAASLLATVENSGDSDGSGFVAAVTATNLSGGSSTSSVYAPAYGSAFNLPGDCLRVIKLDSGDIDIPRNRWEIQGRYLLLEEESAEAPVIHYISNAPPVDEWPTTFTDAVAFLLASRLAPKLAQDQGVAAEFLQKHEMALGKARSKDSRETRSKENHGPRHLAARSGLVRARYGNSHPPY